MFVYYLTFRFILSLPSFPVYDAKISIKHQRICRTRVKIALYVSRLIGANRNRAFARCGIKKVLFFIECFPSGSAARPGTVSCQ